MLSKIADKNKMLYLVIEEGGGIQISKSKMKIEYCYKPVEDLCLFSRDPMFNTYRLIEGYGSPITLIISASKNLFISIYKLQIKLSSLNIGCAFV